MISCSRTNSYGEEGMQQQSIFEVIVVVTLVAVGVFSECVKGSSFGLV